MAIGVDWLTSDQHFFHNNIIKYSNRPFKCVEEMNEVLINNINQHVKPEDTLFHLGDFCFGRNKIGDSEKILQNINCKNVILIIGNHDPRDRFGQAEVNFAALFTASFTVLETTLKDNYLSRFCVLDHFAKKIWNKSHHGAFHFYGHSHYTLPDDINTLSMDVGVDAVAGRATGLTYAEMKVKNAFDQLKPENYRPIRFKEAADFMDKKIFKSIDHHNVHTT